MEKRETGLLFDRYKIVEKGPETDQLKIYFATDQRGHYKVSKSQHSLKLLQKVIIRRYLLGSASEKQQDVCGVPAGAIQEISIYHFIGSHPELQNLIRHDLKQNGLCTLTEHYDRNLAMAFNEAVTQDLFKVNERTAAAILHQLVTAVNRLHLKFVIHGHISLDNLLIAEDQPLKLKLGGIGEAVRFLLVRSSKSCDITKFNSISNLAPELLLNLQKSDRRGFFVRNDKLHFGSDMWAVGCIFFTLLAGYAPFDEDGVYPTLFRIFKTFGTPTHIDLIGPQSIYPELNRMCPQLINSISHFPVWEPMQLSLLFNDQISEHALNLLHVLLQIEPSQRIAASTALQHPFFKQYQL